jgi:YVTN family beta-propeller protein
MQMQIKRFGSLLAVVAALVVQGCGSDAMSDGSDAGPLSGDDAQDVQIDTDIQIDTGPCIPSPPPEALVQVGVKDGVRILPGGRALTPAGTEVVLGGFPIDVLYHPSNGLVYVANTGYTKRSLQVIDPSTGKIISEINRGEAFYGLAISPDGKQLYASGGYAAKVEIYAIAADGKLTGTGQVPIDNYPAGIAVSKDGTRFWVGQFKGATIVEFDAKTLQINRVLKLPIAPYALMELPARHELWVASLAADQIAAIDLAATPTPTVVTVPVGMSPVNLVHSADEAVVYLASANGDAVVAIDAQNHAVIGTQAVGEPSIVGEDNKPLPASSPGGIALDPKENRLYVARAADNAVSVLDAKDLKPIGAIPVSWYPTAVAVSPDGGHLAVTNGKGLGTGPLAAYTEEAESGKQAMKGTISLVDLAQVDLAKATVQVEKNVRRPSEVFPFQCQGVFPVPASPTGATPIEHIVLIVKENKTYDSVLGDMETGNGDPKLAMWGEKITPNLHALARKYAHHDNFYDDSETSIQGHLWLTSSFVDDYMERTWFEDYRNHPGWGEDAVHPYGRPAFKTFFTHLIRHNVDFTMFGEIVGALDSVPEGIVADHVDALFPGSFFNTDISDVDKAKYVADALLGGNRSGKFDDNPDHAPKFPPFSYVLLPNDHTHGLGAGALTPESMINDNDVGMGTLVDAIAHSPFFASTAIFIVEDDPQMGADHVDYHRSFCIVVSPYAKPGYVSHVHTSYPSLFKTFELILHLPPLNRYDALATPMWDVFQDTPTSDVPFVRLERTIPDQYNSGKTLGARISAHMDFSGPDKNPDLGDLLSWHVTGNARPGSRIEAIVAGKMPLTVLDTRADEDADGDDDIYDAAMSEMRRYLAAHPEIKHDMRPRKLQVRRDRD